jgi:hypothetical protein
MRAMLIASTAALNRLTVRLPRPRRIGKDHGVALRAKSTLDVHDNRAPALALVLAGNRRRLDSLLASMPTYSWPAAVIVSFALAGLLSPLIPLAGAIVAYAGARSYQGTILAGVGLAYFVLEPVLAAH